MARWNVPSAMSDDEDLRHPRAVAALRTALYVGMAVLLVLVVFGLLAFLGALAAVGGLLSLLGEGSLLVVGVVGVFGVVLVTATVGGVVFGTRRLERRLVDADRRPDPLEAVKERYVGDDIDEVELEDRLEAVLGDEFSDDETAGGGSSGGRRGEPAGRESDAQRRERER